MKRRYGARAEGRGKIGRKHRREGEGRRKEEKGEGREASKVERRGEEGIGMGGEKKGDELGGREKDVQIQNWICRERSREEGNRR